MTAAEVAGLVVARSRCSPTSLVALLRPERFR